MLRNARQYRIRRVQAHKLDDNLISPRNPASQLLLASRTTVPLFDRVLRDVQPAAGQAARAGPLRVEGEAVRVVGREAHVLAHVFVEVGKYGEREDEEAGCDFGEGGEAHEGAPVGDVGGGVELYGGEDAEAGEDESPGGVS
jgi:hypothetical protein